MPAPINPRLHRLDDYPFRRLDQLLEGLRPAARQPVVMSIGEPQHPAPSILEENAAAERACVGALPADPRHRCPEDGLRRLVETALPAAVRHGGS